MGKSFAAGAREWLHLSSKRPLGTQASICCAQAGGPAKGGAAHVARPSCRLCRGAGRSAVPRPPPACGKRAPRTLPPNPRAYPTRAAPHSCKIFCVNVPVQLRHARFVWRRWALGGPSCRGSKADVCLACASTALRRHLGAPRCLLCPKTAST